MLHEGVGIPRVMVQENTRAGTLGFNLDTWLPVMVDPVIDTPSTRLLVHVDWVISLESSELEVIVD